MRSNLISSILRDAGISDSVNTSYKVYPNKKITTKKLRGSVRAQLLKFLFPNQIDKDLSFRKRHPLP